MTQERSIIFTAVRSGFRLKEKPGHLEGGLSLRPAGKDARMRQFEFPESVMAEIQRDRFYHVDPLVQRRMEVLLLKANGQPVDAASASVGDGIHDPPAAYRWRGV
jgi:hypothetical protein